MRLHITKQKENHMSSIIHEFDKILDQNPEIERYYRDIYNQSANWKIDARLDFQAVRNAKKKDILHPAKEIALFHLGGFTGGATGLLICNTIINAITSENLTQNIGSAAQAGALLGGGIVMVASALTVFYGADMTPRKTAAIKELRQRAQDHRYS